MLVYYILRIYYRLMMHGNSNIKFEIVVKYVYGVGVDIRIIDHLKGSMKLA